MARCRRADEASRAEGSRRDAAERDHRTVARRARLSAYFDSSIVTRWYVPEAGSGPAIRIRDTYEPPAILTHLHRVELTTAWHLKVFRRELRLETVVQALADLEHDVDAGVWEPPAYDLGDVHERAERLARRHAAALGTRSLDILHVAAALSLGSSDFVTGDRRQASLAKAAGLTTVLVGSRS